jgi:tetratricopeptide (TPR) repeat protein
MSLLGRRGELAELDQLLERAAGGSGGVLVLVGPPGSGRTALADLSAERAGHLGFDVLRLAAAERGPGTWMVAQLLRDVAAPEDLVTRLLAGPAPQDLDAAAVLLCSGPPRLVVLDDADRGGHEALQLLAVLAGRAASGRTAVLVTSSSTLGVGHEVGLRPLTPEQVGRAVGETRPEVQKALWAASGGLPGRARALAATLADLPGEADPVVELALRTDSAERFLGVDTGLVLLLESALRRTDDAGPRARLLARLAYALLGDAQAADRRRGLIEEALSAARRSADPAVLAEVLDARLHALWDAAGAHDRLTTADEIAELARGSAQPERERRALFWRFVALMELARVPEAESALAAFERQARLAGDAAAEVMAASRHAMLATLHGRFDDAQRLIDHVAEQGTRIRLADTPWLVGSLRAALGGLRGDPPIGEPGMEQLRAAARTNPGHLYEATTARALLSAGRTAEAAMELERALPLVLAGAGPRWLGAAADLAMVATATRATSAADALYTALIPFRGRLVVWAGANTCTGQVDYHLGLLAAELGRPDDAVALLEDAVALA